MKKRNTGAKSAPAKDVDEYLAGVPKEARHHFLELAQLGRSPRFERGDSSR